MNELNERLARLTMLLLLHCCSDHSDPDGEARGGAGRAQPHPERWQQWAHQHAAALVPTPDQPLARQLLGHRPLRLGAARRHRLFSGECWLLWQQGMPSLEGWYCKPNACCKPEK